MTGTGTSTGSPIVVVGANGLVGAQVCAALVQRGAAVRALVRRAGTAPAVDGVEELVGEFTDADVAARAVAGAAAVVTTVHPMGTDRATQQRIGVDGNALVARAAAAAGVGRLVHISTAAVYDRSPGVGDVDESSPLVGDDANIYAVTKRDTDTAIAAVDGLTRLLLRPPAILGAGPTSVWNTLRPAAIRDDEQERHALPHQSFPWVHVTDLAVLAADLATGAAGPDDGACTAVDVVTGTATQRDYYETVTGALGVDPVWDDGPAWTGRLTGGRARGWGWSPTVDLAAALGEIAAGLRDGGARPVTDDPSGVTAWFVDGPLAGWRGHVPVDPDGEPEPRIHAPHGHVEAPAEPPLAEYVLVDVEPTEDGVRRYRYSAD